MPARTIGPDFTDPQPLTILLHTGKPCRKVIVAPSPSKQATAIAYADRRKAATIEQSTADNRKTITQTYFLYGRNGKDGKNSSEPSPYRGWSSSCPNENFMLLCASGRYGTAKGRLAEGWDWDAYEEAIATRDVAKALAFPVVPTDPCTQDELQQFKGRKGGDQTSETSEDAPTRQCKPKKGGVAGQPVVPAAWNRKVTGEDLNHAYELYVASPETESEAIKTALFLFIRSAGWILNDCKILLGKHQIAATTDDIQQDFALYLIDRFQKGQYQHHEGKMGAWVRTVWTKRFLPDYKEKVYPETFLTSRLNEEKYDSDEAEAAARVAGETYCADVDFEFAIKDFEGINHPTRIVARLLLKLDDPESDWGGFNESTKLMIRNMAKGMRKGKAAKAAGICERHGRKLMDGVVEFVKRKPQMREGLFYILPQEDSGMKGAESIIPSLSACADVLFEPLLDVTQAAELLCLHPKTVQALARSGSVPCVRIGKFWRFRASSLDRWVAERLESTHQSRRVQ